MGSRIADEVNEASSLLLESGTDHILWSATNTSPDGPRYAYTVADDGTGSASWVGATVTVQTSDTSYCTYDTTTLDEVSGGLKLTNLGIALPASSTVVGFEIKVETKSSGASLQSQTFQLLIGSTTYGTAQTETATWTTDTVKTYGGASDMLGSSLTQSDVEGSTFGIKCTCKQLTSTPATFSLDFMRLNVYFTAAGGGGVQMLTLLGVG
jgi:hypothetical protein